MKHRKITNNELKQLHKIELDLLIEFDRICKKHQLKYVLAGGSCIGAVRHNGFIPWDDDIDVHMDRKDYNQFLQVYEKELNHKKYYFQSIETDSKFNLPFAKLRRKDSIYYDSNCNLDRTEQGIFIDIFPCDHISNNNFIMIFYFIKVFILKILYSKKVGSSPISLNPRRNVILQFISFFSIFISTKRCRKLLLKNMTKFNKKDTNRIICYGGRYLFKEILDKNHIHNRILHKFENGQFYITKNYDQYLSKLYGDYMKLPPKETRCSDHFIEELKFPESN